MLVWLISLGHVEFFCSVKEEGNGLSIADYIKRPSVLQSDGIEYKI